MGNKLTESPLSNLVIFISYCILTLQELYFLLQRISSHHFLFISSSSWNGNFKSCNPTNDESATNLNNTTSKEQDMITISHEDLGRIMRNLGIIWEDESGNGIGLVEISSLFNEEEEEEEQGKGKGRIISREEAREAFELFDGNKDGFIDAKELQKVVCALGFKETTETECQKMISVFDCNGDRLIDFQEFLKVLES